MANDNEYTKIICRPFGKDNDLNCFGDYDTLMCQMIGIKSSETAFVTTVKETWTLIGPKNCRVLNEAELFRALTSYFFQPKLDADKIKPAQIFQEALHAAAQVIRTKQLHHGEGYVDISPDAQQLSQAVLELKNPYAA